ncbi:MAG: hypothetical protein L6Q84_12070 [Polyangiaceae bacterium]|nr:hypothetical protein [Polyangiaceae bacterium]
MQLSLVVLLGVVALALFAGVLLVSQVAGAALRRSLGMVRHSLRPGRPIGELTSGPRRMQGFVGLAASQSEREALLTGPVSGRPCLAYELELSADGRRCYSERQALPCVVRDGSGELELPMSTAELSIERREAWRGVLESAPPPGLSPALCQKLVAAKNAFIERERLSPAVPVELAVKTIGTGDLLYVSGEVIQGGPRVSLISGRPVCVSDRPFAEVAKKEGLFAVAGVAFALFIVSVVVAVATSIVARTRAP